MENEKYVITIDGTDCTGKSTLWKKANGTNKNIQIRGIVSNIAYAIKYGRNVGELIDLYNENPINYVVYLINPINDKKLEMLYNRIRNEMINDNDAISKELTDAGNTWKDYEYFTKAIETLKTHYKGKLEIIESKDNDYAKFINRIESYNLYDIDEKFNNPAIKVLSCDINDFEALAKTTSEFKYIVFFTKLDKEAVINNLYAGLDDNHQKMYNKLFEYTTTDIDDVYDNLYEYTPDALAEYLDDYELRVEVNVKCDVSTWTEVNISLRETINSECLEDTIYDDNCIMDDIYDAVKDSVYNEEVDIEVDRVR